MRDTEPRKLYEEGEEGEIKREKRNKKKRNKERRGIKRKGE